MDKSFDPSPAGCVVPGLCDHVTRVSWVSKCYVVLLLLVFLCIAVHHLILARLIPPQPGSHPASLTSCGIPHLYRGDAVPPVSPHRRIIESRCTLDPAPGVHLANRPPLPSCSSAKWWCEPVQSRTRTLEPLENTRRCPTGPSLGGEASQNFVTLLRGHATDPKERFISALRPEACAATRSSLRASTETPPQCSAVPRPPFHPLLHLLPLPTHRPGDCPMRAAHASGVARCGRLQDDLRSGREDGSARQRSHA